MGLFDSIRSNRPKLNKFDLSHERKFSFKMGQLVPVYVQDVVPGDSFRVKSELLLRMAPMLAPIMHRVNVTVRYFFVPNRLVWSEWEDFITGGREGTSAPVAPFIEPTEDDASDFGKGTLADFLGVPDLEALVLGAPWAQSPVFSALPFRAYQLIYNEYFRDQNLSEPIIISKASGQDVSTGALRSLRYSCWEKDYFTSALPWAQRGAPVDLPIGSPQINYKDISEVYQEDGSPTSGGTLSNPNTDRGLRAAGGAELARIENIESIDFESVTINDLRTSIKLQEWLERNARGGARYVEQIWSHFGVHSSDARLQRPEYLGGGKAPVVISEVLQTTDGATEPLGTMGGHGVSVGHQNKFSKRFEEHGYVIGLVTVLPRTAYQQGIPRHLHRFDKTEYFWPEFAHLGEQAIKRQELFLQPAVAGYADETFGYQSRYAEYKYGCSSVHGDFKDNLSFWHMGRIFAPPPFSPILNAAFVSTGSNNGEGVTDRIFAVQDGTDTLWCQLYNNVSALRPMPYFGTPTF